MSGLVRNVIEISTLKNFLKNKVTVSMITIFIQISHGKMGLYVSISYVVRDMLYVTLNTNLTSEY